MFAVLKWHIKDKVCVFWCMLKLCRLFSCEVVCECSDDFVLGEVCVKLPLYVWKYEVFVCEKFDDVHFGVVVELGCVYGLKFPGDGIGHNNW